MSLASAFRYRRTTVSVAMVIALCAVLFLELEYANRAFWAPEGELLGTCWSHLQTISADKHPFTSPHNDRVRIYLQETVSELINNTKWAEMETDVNSGKTIFFNQHDVFNATNDANRMIYYESSNVMVKLEGKNTTLDGVLVSAHFDSVPTSFGAIDDGMGIVSMLGALENILKKGMQPERTLVFNFNNNEEFGLLGAEAFVRSSWFKRVSLFLNLEGTGSGQYAKPILFRGTDKEVLDWYSHVTFPFASSSFMQGFKNGLVRSQTDYHVYQEAGLRGIDVAFFEPRSWYHTLRDGVLWTSKGSLWMMLRNTMDILDLVAFSAKETGTEQQTSIFFDIFDRYYVNVALEDVITLNVLLVVFLPLVNVFLLSNINANKKSWFVGFSGWFRLPITIAVTYVVSKILINYLQRRNPLLVSVSYIQLIVLFACVSFLVGYLILKLASTASPVHDQKFHLILEINGMLWVGTVYCIYSLTEYGGQSVACTGLYVPVMYMLSELSVVVGAVGLWARRAKKFDRSDVTVEHVANGDVISESHSAIQDPRENIETSPPADPQEPTETTPMLTAEQQDVDITYPSYEEYLKSEHKRALKSPQYEWPLQFILMVPIPLYLILREGLLIGLALHETVQESGTYDHFVWNVVCFLGVVVGSVSWVWADKMRATIVTFVVLALVCTSYQLGAFSNIWHEMSMQNIDGVGNRPFASEKYPLKMRFVEEFNVNSNSSKAVVYGRAPYTEQILLDTPWIENHMALGSNEVLACTTNNVTSMQMCEFEGERPWLLSGSLEDNLFSHYLNVTVLSNTNNGSNTLDKYSPFESIVQIRVKGSRQCHLAFNSTNPKVPTPVKAITIYRGDNWKKDMYLNPSKDIPIGISEDSDGNWSARIVQGIEDLTLHKMAWSSIGAGSAVTDTANVFTVKLEWLPFTYDSDFSRIEDLGLSVACQWSDFDEKTLVSNALKARVETLTELIDFAGRDAAFTNLKAGVVNGVLDVTL